MRSNVLIIYYAATALFLALDYGFGINLRAAFLENMPEIVNFIIVGGAAYVSYVQGAKALASRLRSD